MNYDGACRLASTGSGEVEDPVLDQLDMDVPDADAADFREIPVRPLDDPFELEIVKPRAVSIERMYELSRKAVPPELRAALGANYPLLILHGITPFYKTDRKPSGIWGLGYRVAVDEERCATVAVFPETRRYRMFNASEQFSVGIKAGGEIGTQEIPGIQILGGIAKLDLRGVSVKATNDAEFGLSARLSVSVLEVLAAPVGAGGARWDIYRGRESIQIYQPLLQTLLAPRERKTLRFRVETWIRTPGRFFGLSKARHWDYPSQSFEVSIESD